MNKEQEEVREQIITILEEMTSLASSGAMLYHVFGNKSGTGDKRTHGDFADQIIALGAIQIKAKDQSLPESNQIIPTAVSIERSGQKEMLNEGFIKCLKKGE